MIYKILSRFLFVSFAILINFCSAYFNDYEPNILSKNLRLAAIGNLDLVVIERVNEINAYDFGESPAGAISDNNGQSEICIPFLYGFTIFSDTLYDFKWHAFVGSISSVFKPWGKVAIGGSFSRANAKEEMEPWMGSVYEYDRDVTRYSLIANWKAISRVTIGFRGAYNKLTEERSDYIGTYIDEAKVFSYEPSLLISSGSGHWQYGLDYKYKKYSREYGDTVIHEFAIPVIHSSSNLELGIRATLGTIPDTATIKSIKMRSFYILPFGNKHLNFGFQLGYASPHIMDDFYYGYAPGYQTNMGFGMAYVNKGIGLLGIQYRKEILTYTGITNSYSIHRNCLGIGAEIRLFNAVPLRLGYTNINQEPSIGIASYHDVITWGFGFQVPAIDLKVDFAHNIYVYKHVYEEMADFDHTFGIAGYFDF